MNFYRIFPGGDFSIGFQQVRGILEFFNENFNLSLTARCKQLTLNIDTK